MGDEYPRTGGCLRRLIDVRTEHDGAVIAWVEDDFHHFGVTLEHEGQVVTGIRAAALRVPFSTCPMAGAHLQQVIGKPLSPRASDIGGMIDMRQQCTHMFDLAGLAMAQAAACRSHRRYEAIVDDRDIRAWEAGRRRLLGVGRARLLRDGAQVLCWDIEEREITGPGDWAGQSLNRGFRARTEAMNIDDAEAATVLRRAIMVASGRTMNPDTIRTAGERGQSNVCFTFQEERRDLAVVEKGAAKNYESGSEGMLAHIDRRP